MIVEFKGVYMGVFHEKDIMQIEKHGLSLDRVQKTQSIFENGIPYEKLEKPAVLGDGIVKLSPKAKGFYRTKYENTDAEVVKFTPASGAATRMFKNLITYRKGGGNADREDVSLFFSKIEDLAFYPQLIAEVEKHFPKFDTCSQKEREAQLLQTLFDEDKLNFLHTPKGLVPFHRSNNETRTAFEEHFVEALTYAVKSNKAQLHFTISENHTKVFEREKERLLGKYKDQQIDVSFSFQDKDTDTLAVDMNNKPFRDENGRLLFRPAGHGALLNNLNKIDADIVFVKNIDNVANKAYLPTLADYKKALAGFLLDIQQESFGLLKELKANKTGSNALERGLYFLEDTFGIRVENVDKTLVFDLLNRPIRVCGMVKNTGAPGGGPFWVKDKYGRMRLQIVETAQINQNDDAQKAILEKATHFNPVDLVCGVKNFEGEKFNLLDFADMEKGFITKKYLDGRPLKALELPGLWNASMDQWNTVFVEVPLETFSPVKKVTDLFAAAHMPEQ